MIHTERPLHGRLMTAMLLLMVAGTTLTGCKKDDEDPDPVIPPVVQNAPDNVLYVTTNDPAGNAVVAYTRDPVLGTLTMIGTYSTGGTGFSNPTLNKLGPNDADLSLTVSDDHKRLFAVNGGSNSIAVFNLNEDGTMAHVSGSPFPSGGRQPVSVDAYGSHLYVVNKNQDTLQLPNADLPNYTVFNVSGSGALSQVMGATVNTQSGASPSVALVSLDGTLVFGADFLVPVAHPGSGSLRSFIATGGMLANSPGSPAVVPGDVMTNLPLGLWQHPVEDVLYVGLPARNKVGVYTFGSNGGLVYVTEVNNSGGAVCWLRSNAAGDRLYSLNSGSNSISVYNTSDPMNPMETQHFLLSQPGPSFTTVMGNVQPVTSGSFFEELAPDERFLYTVNQRQNYFSPDQGGNNIHILSVSSDGTLSEPFTPISIPTPATARPVGLVVL